MRTYIKSLSHAILVFFFLLQSCGGGKQQNDYVVIDKFPVSVELDTIRTIRPDGVVGLLSLAKAGDYFVGELFKQNHCFQLFDSLLNPIAPFARKGRGPEEYYAPTYMGQYEQTGNANYIWILDRALSQFMKINLNTVIETQTVPYETMYEFTGKDNMHLRSLFYINDKLLLGTLDDQECKVVSYNPTDKKKTEYANFMEFPYNQIDDIHGLSQNMCALKPDKSRMASVFFYLPQIDLYDSTGTRYLSIFHEQMLPPKKADQSLDTEFYLQVCATDKYVYALMQAKQEREKCRVQVYDWNGAPKAELIINPASNFCVSNNGNYLYAIYFDTEKETITQYDMRNIL